VIEHLLFDVYLASGIAEVLLCPQANPVRLEHLGGHSEHVTTNGRDPEQDGPVAAHGAVVDLPGVPAHTSNLNFLVHDELSILVLLLDIVCLIVHHRGSVLCRLILYGILELVSLDCLLFYLELLGESGVSFECGRKGALTLDATIVTESDDELSNWAGESKVMRLHEGVSNDKDKSHMKLVTYDEDDCATLEQVTLETLLDDPSSSVHVEGSKDLVYS
jgi:hypothetical protein